MQCDQKKVREEVTSTFLPPHKRKDHFIVHSFPHSLGTSIMQTLVCPKVNCVVCGLVLGDTVTSPWCWGPAGRPDYKIVPMLVTMVRSESFLKP